jgi:tetratricopeptide (TPR) repeat protein
VSIGEEVAKARACHEQGRLADADQMYRAVLARNPAHAEALLCLGALRLQQGRPQEALSLTAQALETAPRSAEAHSNLGTALSLLGRHDEAIASYQAAIACDPDHAEAHYGLATVLQTLGRHVEAVACYDQALAIDPDYAEAHCGRAAVLRALKRDEEAVAGFRQALDIDPDYPAANVGIASALHALNRFEEALTHYQRALAAKPDILEILGPLAGVLQRLNRHGEALPYLHRDLAARPHHPVPHLNLGVALEEMGKLDEAVACFERALALDPNNVRAHYALLQSRRAVAGEPHLLTLQSLADKVDALADDDRVLMHFALGKALTDVGEPDRGFQHLLAGNALRRRQVTYDEAGVLGLSRRIAAVFTSEMISSRDGMGHASTVPIFIIGMPRSGSTLVEQILASHPQVFGGGERNDFRAAMTSAGLNNAATAFPEAVRTFGPRELRQLGADYLARLTVGAPACERITDKTLGNFGAAGLIHLALPNARIIHTSRDPVDTCLSCFSLLFSGEQPFTFDLGELGRYYAAYHALMAHW